MRGTEPFSASLLAEVRLKMSEFSLDGTAPFSSVYRHPLSESQILECKRHSPSFLSWNELQCVISSFKETHKYRIKCFLKSTLMSSDLFSYGFCFH